MKWATTSKTIEEGLKSGEIQVVLGNSDQLSDEYISSLAHTKRFLERWSADEKFRVLAATDVHKAVKDYHLKADPDEIRLLWDSDWLKNHRNQEDAIPLAVRRYESFIQEKLRYRDVIRRSSHPKDERFKEWRSRQIYRTFSELGIMKAHGIVHAPVVFELSKGCSVGCWFCGVAAPKLNDIWSYEKNATLWKGALKVVHEVIGDAAAKGFCYWASDPLDNPDYEKFLIDFHAELGKFPQTTTAIPQRDFQRTRDLLALARSKNGELNRFSIITLSQFDKVMEAFTAEELLLVEMVTQNDGALTAKAVAGRAREDRFRKKLEKNHQSADPEITSTIACVSGFLFNMVDQVVRLISPCNACDKWPLGYRIFEEGHFNSAEELRVLMNGMIDRHMLPNLSFNTDVEFSKELSYEATENGFMLVTKATRMVYKDKPIWEAMAKLFESKAINGLPVNVGNIALTLEKESDIPLEETIFYFQQLYKEGIFEIEPTWKPSPGIVSEEVFE